jgi:hypothetical protein
VRQRRPGDGVEDDLVPEAHSVEDSMANSVPAQSASQGQLEPRASLLLVSVPSIAVTCGGRRIINKLFKFFD